MTGQITFPLRRRANVFAPGVISFGNYGRKNNAPFVYYGVTF